MYKLTAFINNKNAKIHTIGKIENSPKGILGMSGVCLHKALSSDKAANIDLLAKNNNTDVKTKYSLFLVFIFSPHNFMIYHIIKIIN